MSSGVGINLRALRKKHRDLLQQLETNSAILEQRLIKLRQEARTPRHSEKYWRNVPPSHLKAEFVTSKTRNDPERFQSPKKSDSFCDNSDEESVNEMHNPSGKNMKKYFVSESVTPHSKRPRPFLVTSSYKKKRKIHRKSNNKSTRKLLKRQYDKYRRKIKPCTECYCSGQSVTEDSEISDDSFREYVCKHHHSKKLPKTIKVDHPIMQQVPHNDFQFKCLKNSHNLIDYSPESRFLQRLKQRTQTSNDIAANKKYVQLAKDGGNVCACCSQLHKKCFGSSKCKSTSGKLKYPKCNSSKVTCSSHRSNVDDQHSLCFCDSEASEENRLKGMHKESGHKIGSCNHCTLENYEKKLLHAEKLGSKCSCQRSKERNSEESWCQSKAECCKQSSDNKFKSSDAVFENERINDLIEFRRSHWNDCHSHCTDLQSKSSRNEGIHECVHHFTLNQRLIPEPVYKDSHGGSCCAECLVPECKSLPLNLSQCSRKAESTDKSSREFNSNHSTVGCRNITLPIKGDALKIVTVPVKLLEEKEKTATSTEKQLKKTGKLQSCPLTHGASKVFRAGRAPAPTNSYALRFQKGLC